MPRGILSNTVTLKEGANPSDAVRWQDENDHTWTLRFQVTGTIPEGSVVALTIQQLMGDGTSTATFTRTVDVGLAQRTVRVQGRSVLVSAQLTGRGNGSVTLAAALCPYDSDSLGEMLVSWVPCNNLQAAGIATTLNVPSSGALLYAQGSVTNVPEGDTEYWVMFFDEDTLPTAGDSPILAVGPYIEDQPFSIDYADRPILFYGTGLSWALSTTANVYTAASSGATARVDVGIGQ